MTDTQAGARQMHLIQMLFHMPTSHTIGAWTDPADEQLAGLSSIAYWQKLARLAEKGCLDGIFFADTPAPHDRYRDGPFSSIEYGAHWPTHDPLAACAVMAAATERLGFGTTMSITGTPPYLAVRRISTLDCMSGGRFGWNIVTGHVRGEHLAVGVDQLPHDERYDYADEYMEVCYRLWDSVPSDAVIADEASGVFVDISKVKMVDFQGKYFRCKAVGPTLHSRQGRPLLIQAGSSGRGMRFAVAHAELVFAIQPDLARMCTFMERVTAAAAELGKPPPPVIFGIQPVLGGTEEEARKRLALLQERAAVEGALSRMSGTLGVDFSKFDLDKPIKEMATDASQGMMAAIAGGNAHLTLRELARKVGVSAGIPQFVGTPEQFASHLEELWRASGCHGFNISPTVNPRSLAELVEEVVPILQRRGLFRTEYRGHTFRDHLSN